MASSLLTKIQTKLQANPIKGFSLAKKTQGFGVSSLRDLPPTLKGKYYDGILLAVSNSFNFLPNDVLWDNAAKLAVLAHPTFLDKLEEGLDAALNSFKFEIKTVLNAKTKNLYILADEKNMGIVKALEEEEQTLPAPYGAGSTMEPGGRIVTPDQAERAVSLIEIPSGEYSTGLYSVSITFFSCSPRLVTNSEYAEFMKTDPYNRASFWSKPGWAWIQKRRIDGPRLLRGGRFSQPDQPVVCVSWYEAQAYLKWAGMRFLTQHEMLYLAMSNLVQKVPAVRGMTIDSPEWLSDWYSESYPEQLRIQEGKDKARADDLDELVGAVGVDMRYRGIINPRGPMRGQMKMFSNLSGSVDSEEPQKRSRLIGFRAAKSL